MSGVPHIIDILQTCRKESMYYSLVLDQIIPLQPDHIHFKSGFERRKGRSAEVDLRFLVFQEIWTDRLEDRSRHKSLSAHRHREKGPGP